MSNQSDPIPSPFWDRQRHQDRRPFLLARSQIKRALRGWFEDQGFLEVDCGCLQVSPGNETHLQAFATCLHNIDGSSKQLYLHSSPEFACKKLLAAGEDKIFTFAPVFRNKERGPLHHPEFTMLEWYRAGSPYETLMADCAQIMRLAASAVAETATKAEPVPFVYRNVAADPLAAPEHISVAEALARFANIDLFDSITATSADRDRLAAAAQAQNIRVADDDCWSDIFWRVLTQRVEPKLGQGRGYLLYEYPISEAALARPASQDPRVAERFELYACGVELANGFGELTDPEVQRHRFEKQMGAKQRIYGESYPIDEDFLAALAEMPPASGCALGFDRLVMLASGAHDIDTVIWTPMAR